MRGRPEARRCLSGYIAPGLRLDGATMYSAEDLEVPVPTPASRRPGYSARHLAAVTFHEIREQWGLKLEAAQGPFKVFVVESPEPPG